MSDDRKVVELFPANAEPSGNVRCECGGEWWKTDVVIDAAKLRATAFTEPIECSSCGVKRDWPVQV